MTAVVLETITDKEKNKGLFKKSLESKIKAVVWILRDDLS